MAPHIGAKIAPSLDVRQNRTLLKIPSIPSKLMRSLSSSSRQVAAKSTGTGRCFPCIHIFALQARCCACPSTCALLSELTVDDSAFPYC